MMPKTTDSPVKSPDTEISSASDVEADDLNRFHTLDDLHDLPTETLEELWLACPDRVFYENALRQTVEDTFGSDGIVPDMDRLSVIDECLAYYRGDHPDLPGPGPRIPGTQGSDGRIRWFKVSDRIRERTEAGLSLDDPTGETKKNTPEPKVIVAGALLIVTLICVLTAVLRNAFGTEEPTEADLTATALEATALALLPQETATPTPLALENIDRPIRAGDDLRDLYPVILELAPAGETSRVFPVQQREVEIAEWDYDLDPDVASTVLGLVVQPVLGIPYTADNAVFLENMHEGDRITLRMSTGNTLTYSLTAQERIPRQVGDLFDQGQPGIAIVLLDDPAPDRLVLYGEPVPEDEQLITAPSDNSLSSIPEGVTGTLGSFEVTVLESRLSSGHSSARLGADWVYLLVDMDLHALEATHTRDLDILLVDGGGNRYVSVEAEGLNRYTAFSPLPLEADQRYRASLAYIIPRSLSDPTLEVRLDDESLDVALEVDSLTPLTVELLEVTVSDVSAEEETLSVSLTLFNPHGEDILVTTEDIGAVMVESGDPEVFPLGPIIRPSEQDFPLTVESGQRQELTVSFPWSEESVIGLMVGGYRYVAVLP